MRPVTSFLLAGSLIAFSSAAHAQSDAAADGAIDDIIVTARKTSESLQTTPVAVTALTSEDLERQQIIGVTQLQNLTPNLVFSSAVSQPGSATIFMRGQGSTDGLIAIDQAVGAYVNGVYLARSTGGAFDMIDIARVEVLRGPQGTLFGRNTTGGAINIVPKEPDGELGGELRADYGNYNTLLLRGVVNLPLQGDELGVRVAGQHRRHDGFGRNRTTGAGVNKADSDYLRATLRLAPVGGGFSALIAGDYSKFSNGGELVGLRHLSATAPTRDLLVAICNGVASTPALNSRQSLCSQQARGPLTDFQYGAPGSKVGFYDVYYNTDTYGRSKSHGLSSVLTYDIGESAQVKSTTAWRSVDMSSRSDQDGTPYHLSGAFNDSFGIRVSQDQFSSELQLSGKMGIVDFILGGFYFVENGTDIVRSGNLYPASLGINFTDGTVRNRSLAGYGQLIAHVTPSLRLTGGVRYTEDKRQLTSRNRSQDSVTGITVSSLPTIYLDGDSADPFRASFSRTFNYVSWLAAIDWEASRDIFLYAKASRSQRSGGFNTRIVGGVTPPISFEPERVTDFEVGAKLSLLNRRVRANIALFNTNVDDVQRNLTGSVGTTLVSGIDNAAKSRIRGLEMELTVAPGGGFTFGATVGYIDASYRRFINSIDNTDWSDTQFPYAAKYNYSIRADYDLVLSNGMLKFHTDYAWRSKLYTNALAISAAARVGLTPAQVESGSNALQETARIDGYGLLNGRIAYAFDQPNVEIAVYAQNITRKKYITRLLAVENSALGFTAYAPGDPRTYGMSVSIKF